MIDPLKSGDLEKAQYPDGNTALHKHESSEALKQANEIVKKKFTLDFNSRREAVKIIVHQVMDRVRRHDMDTSSMEAKGEFFFKKINLNEL
jgi:hypothetical protein